MQNHQNRQHDTEKIKQSQRTDVMLLKDLL